MGTIYMDFRSQFLHFECGVYLYKTPVIRDIRRDFDETLKRCMPMTMEDCKKLPLWYRFTGRALRLVAPLM